MKIVLTNGCFDILHRGHVEFLNRSKELGDRLIVLLNSDESVKKLKGNSRPINNQEDRKFMLLNLKAVDEVIIFNDENCSDEIRRIHPDIYTKSLDYERHFNEEEQKALDDIGIEPIWLSFAKTYSTTKLIEKIKSI